MKLIIGVYDREVSHNLSIILASKNVMPIEVESMEEIPALLELHPGAMLLSEEISVSFYQQLKQKKLAPDIFLLFHPTLSSEELLKLRQYGLKALIPYTEDATAIIEIIIRQLSMLISSEKANAISKMQEMMQPDKELFNRVAIHLIRSKKWVYGTLLGFNSSKVSVSLSNQDVLKDLISERESDNLLMYLQGMNIRVFADLIYQNKDNYVFRYRKMTQESAKRLAYYIHYCQTHQEVETITMNL